MPSVPPLLLHGRPHPAPRHRSSAASSGWRRRGRSTCAWRACCCCASWRSTRLPSSTSTCAPSSRSSGTRCATRASTCARPRWRRCARAWCWWRSGRRGTACSGTTACLRRRSAASPASPPWRPCTARCWLWASYCATRVRSRGACRPWLSLAGPVAGHTSWTPALAFTCSHRTQPCMRSACSHPVCPLPPPPACLPSCRRVHAGTVPRGL